MGFAKTTQEKGGISLSAHLNGLIRLNNRAHIPSRFIIRLAQFKATHFSFLEKTLKTFPWQDFIGVDSLCIRVSLHHCKLYHSGAVQERALRAISETLQKSFTLSSSPESNNTQLILIHGQDDTFTLSIDSSGAHLHQRGCLTLRGEAPLRETIAAAMLRALKPDALLWDPLCGSGTIPIEHALMSRNIPAFRYRSFSYESWPCFNTSISEQVHSILESEVISCSHHPIIASDLDPDVIELCRKNVSAAGLSDDISIECREFEGKLPGEDLHSGFVVSNPPYGKRLEHNSSLFRSLTRLKKQSPHVRIALLLPRSFIQPRDTVHFTTRNGGLKVCLKEL